MSFRADEAAADGRDKVVQWYIDKLPQKVQRDSHEKLLDLILKHGPVVESYPIWHPLVWATRRQTNTRPQGNEYGPLDHTVYLRDAFITCPYVPVKEMVKKVRHMDVGPWASLEAEELDFPLYHESAHPALVYVEWQEDRLTGDRFLPQRTIVGRMLESEIPCWQTAEVAETWDSMRPYLLGRPCGARSSLFVHEQTGMAMKRVWNALVESGVYGPVKVGRG